MTTTRRRVNGSPVYISGMSVGSTITFEMPELDNGYVRQRIITGVILTFAEDRTGTMPRIRFTLEGSEREFCLRHDFEVRIP